MNAPVLTPRAVDFPRWYQELLGKAELAENGPVRGTMIILEHGYAIWERMQADLDRRIKLAGARNMYFPLFIPEQYLSREAEHVEGFSPELAVVTHAGGRPLEEAVIVRPTSETVVGDFMARRTQSYRDLPLLLNQWCNVVRWEKRPRLFLRTSEFLWQEGHTAHADEAAAAAYARRIHTEVYARFMRETLALPVTLGRKTAQERFAGATNTLTLEAMMGDGKALQIGTSHELGQNFARVFGIRFLAEDDRRRTAWTTSWGTSTRMMGGLIMAHGDDQGLRLPPALAPVQVLVTVVKDGRGVLDTAERLHRRLTGDGIRAEVDARVDVPYGRRAVDAELRGHPVRIVIGPRDVAADQAMLIERITGARAAVPLADAVRVAHAALDRGQQVLYDEAAARQAARTAAVSTLADAVAQARTGWATMPWAKVGDVGETRLRASSVSVRCLTLPDGTTPAESQLDEAVAVIARAY